MAFGILGHRSPPTVQEEVGPFLGSLADGGSYRFSSHDGDVVVGLDGDLNAVVTMETHDGDFEVGFPITAQVWPQPPLNKKEWHYTQVASAVHRGDYDGSADTIEEILVWIDANGYQQEGPILGRFTVIPSPEVRTRDLRTEIWVPIKKK